MGAMGAFDLVNRVMVSVRAAPPPTNAALYGEINDALHSGVLQAWGRPSRGYPSKPGPQFPQSQPIPPQFWKDNVIEQLHDFYQRGGKWSPVFEPRKELTVTKPVSGWLSRKWFRNRALHYWDISFDIHQVHKLWHQRGSWMSM